DPDPYLHAVTCALSSAPCHLRQKSYRSRPGRKPAASATSTATSNRSPTRQSWWESLPNDTARPPSSRHQPSSSTEASGLLVLTSSARSDSASARSTARYSSSKAFSSYRPALGGQY